MSVDPAGIYQAVLVSTSEVPVSLQHHIFEYAKRVKNHELLATLASIAGLDPALDERLGAIPNYQVQAAYLTRPGRDLETLSLRAQKDKRVAVGQALAAMKGLTDLAYEALSASSSRSVLIPLVENLSAPLATRSRAMSTLVTHCATANWPERAAIRRLMASYPETLPVALKDMRSMLEDPSSSVIDSLSVVLVEFFGSSAQVSIDDLSTQASSDLSAMLTSEFLRRTDAWVKMLAKTTNSWRVKSDLSEVIDLATRAATSPSITRTTRAILMEAITDHPNVFTQGYAQTTFDVTRLVAILAQNPSAIVATSPAQVARETDPGVLVTIARDIDPRSPTSGALASALLANPHATSELVNIIASVTPRLHVDTAGAIRAHLGSPEMLIQLLNAYPITITDEFLESTGKPHEMIMALLDADPVRYSHQLSHSAYLDEQIVARFPVSSLSSGLMTKLTGAPLGSPAQRIAIALITKTLGENIRAWEIFSDAVSHAPSTIEHLLAHSITLASHLGKRT